MKKDYHFRSFWTYWLGMFPEVDSDRARHEYWGRILKVLLLHGARAQDSADFFDYVRKWVDRNSSTSIIQESIIKGTAMILSHGLDLNEPKDNGHTLWTDFVDHLCLHKSADEKKVLRLLQILTLFLRYGTEAIN
jgi:hypothetical protein